MSATEELLRLLDGFEYECFMLRVEASETRAKDEVVREAYERIREVSAQAIVATLGSGKLTAEQVREAIFKGSVYANYDGAQYYASGISMQAIADELNAALSGGTCENANKDGYSFRFECSKCGYGSITTNCRTRNDELPKFCPNCGKAVKR